MTYAMFLTTYFILLLFCHTHTYPHPTHTTTATTNPGTHDALVLITYFVLQIQTLIHIPWYTGNSFKISGWIGLHLCNDDTHPSRHISRTQVDLSPGWFKFMNQARLNCPDLGWSSKIASVQGWFKRGIVASLRLWRKCSQGQILGVHIRDLLQMQGGDTDVTQVSLQW